MSSGRIFSWAIEKLGTFCISVVYYSTYVKDGVKCYMFNNLVNSIKIHSHSLFEAIIDL